MLYKISMAGIEDINEMTQSGGRFISASPSSEFVSYHKDGCGQMLTNLVHRGALKIWVCRQDKELVGYIGLLVAPNIYNPTETLGDIYFVDVFEEHRKNGIATELIKTVEKYAKNNSITSLSISFNDFDIAKHIVDKMNYTPTEYKLMKRIKE